MEETMRIINEVMNICRESVDNVEDDYQRGTLILSLVFNIARLAGEEGVSQQQVARDALGTISTGYKDGDARRAAQTPAY